MTGAERPPHDVEAERSVLGGVLLRASVLDEIAGLLEVDHFFLPAHRSIYEAMRHLAGKGLPVDAITVCDEIRRQGGMGRLEGGEGYFLTLANAVPTAEATPHYARIVADKAALRRLIAACADTMARAYACEHADELLAEHRLTVASIEAGPTQGPVRIGDYVAAALTEVEQKADKPEKYAVMTGLRAFDGKIGGLRAGQLIIVAGNPGAGKSAWAWCTAIRAATAQTPTLVFSLEMKLQAMVERGLSFASGVPGIDIVRGKVDVKGWPQLERAGRTLMPLPLWLDDRRLSSGKICALARQWRRRHAPTGMAMVVVDYAQIVKPDHRTGNRAQDVADISGAMQELAGEIDVPVVLVSALNRKNTDGGKESGEAREPVIADLKDSSALEYDANMILFPWRDPGDKRPSGLQPAHIIVAKHKNGPTGRVSVLWSPELMAFYDVEMGQEAEDDRRLPPDR